jgi:hypothetical protein
MSLIKANAVQIGQSGTATQNFTLAVPSSPDGTIKLARGNANATTQDVLSVDASGNINGLVKSTGSTTARSLVNRFADVVNVKDFGAVGDGVADDTAAIQAFFNYVTSNGAFGIITKGIYKVSSNLTITINGYGFSILGAGNGSVFFKASNAFPATPVINILGTSGSNVGFVIGGFTITTESGYTGNATCGLQIGNPSQPTYINGYQFSTIQDLNVIGFPIQYNIVHARMIKFNNCSGWNPASDTNNICLNIYQNGYFTGDLVFDTCQFVSLNQSGKIAVNFSSDIGPYNGLSGNYSISGINFINCDFYAGENCVKATVSNGAYLSDIWFTNVQIDQETTNCFNFAASGDGSVITNIHIADCYMQKATYCQILFNVTNLASVGAIFIHDNYINQTDNMGINFYSNNATIRGVNVNNNIFTDPFTGTALIIFNNIKRFSCTNNTAVEVFNPAAFAEHIVQIENGCDKFLVSGNNGANFTALSVINDLSGNVEKTITNNPGYNPIGLQTITVGASPFSYVNNSGTTQIVTVANGTVTALNNSGITMGVLSGGNYIVVASGKTLIVTYSSTPNMYSQGL